MSAETLQCRVSMEADWCRLSVLIWGHSSSFQTSIRLLQTRKSASASLQCKGLLFKEPGAAWTERAKEGEGERENKHRFKEKKDALHEFPKNLKGKFCDLAGVPEEACGQWVWLGSVSQPALFYLLVAFIQLPQKATSLHASPSPTVSLSISSLYNYRVIAVIQLWVVFFSCMVTLSTGIMCVWSFECNITDSSGCYRSVKKVQLQVVWLNLCDFSFRGVSGIVYFT